MFLTLGLLQVIEQKIIPIFTEHGSNNFTVLQKLPINYFNMCLVAAFSGEPCAYPKKLHMGAD